MHDCRYCRQRCGSVAFLLKAGSAAGMDQVAKALRQPDLAECARLLALNVAHYKAKYGELPLEEHQAMLEANDIDEDLVKLLASGVLEMISVLALVIGRETTEADGQIH